MVITIQQRPHKRDVQHAVIPFAGKERDSEAQNRHHEHVEHTEDDKTTSDAETGGRRQSSQRRRGKAPTRDSVLPAGMR